MCSYVYVCVYLYIYIYMNIYIYICTHITLIMRSGNLRRELSDNCIKRIIGGGLVEYGICHTFRTPTSLTSERMT